MQAGPGSGPPPIIDAVGCGDTAEIARILALSPGEITAVDNPASRMGVLHHAPTPEVAELLIRHGAEVDARDASGRTPLHFMAESHCPTIARVLVQNGADVHAVDTNGRTPLSRTAESREPSPEIARLMLAHGATLDLASALMLDWVDEARALLSGDPRAVASSPSPEYLLTAVVHLIGRLLLDSDDAYDYSHGPQEVNTPSVAAIVMGHIDLLDALIARGAPLTEGFLALRSALQLPHTAVAERLLAASVPLSDPRFPGPPGTGLLAAAERSAVRSDMLAMLRRYGVPPGDARPAPRREPS